MPLKLLSFKDFIISEYRSGKSCQKIADENSWYQQAVDNILKSEKLYDSYRPNQGNTRYFQKCDSYIKAYLLGFIAADGCLQTNGANSYGLTITIKDTDIQILERLKLEIGSENPISLIKSPMSHDKSKNKAHCRFQLFNKELFKDLESYGLASRKSTTMPNIIGNIPKRYRKSFIIGYLDGDGSISNKTQRSQCMVSFRGTYDFLEGVAQELKLSKYWLVKDKQKNCSSLVFWRKADLINFAKIYKNLDFFLTRKYERLSSFLKIDKDETISPS